MKLYFYGHEMISQPQYPRVESTEGLALVKSQMVTVMERYKLRGLAAPQLGIMLQVIVVRLDAGTYLDLVNPQITRMQGVETEELESCISCPPDNNVCKVARMQIIQVRAASIYDLDNVSDMRFKDQESRVIQHEVDHLEGTFFFTRASTRDRNLVERKFKEWRHSWKLNNERNKAMASIPAVAPVRRREAVPQTSPLEAPNLVCSACGEIMKMTVIKGPRIVDELKYSCVNEETGCNYELVRKVPVQNHSGLRGIRPKPATQP